MATGLIVVYWIKGLNALSRENCKKLRQVIELN